MQLLLVITSIFFALLPYVTVWWPSLSIFLLPVLYLIYRDDKRLTSSWKSDLAVAFFGAPLALFPAIFYNLHTYLLGVILSAGYYSIVFISSRYLIRYFNYSRISIFVPVFVWTVLSMIFDFHSLVSAVMDVGVMMSFSAPLIWYIGSIGITFLVILFNSALSYYLAIKDRVALIIAASIGVVFALCFIYSNAKDIKDLIDGAKPIKISLIQGSFPEHWRWLEKNIYVVLERYQTLSLVAAKDKPDIIVWPEYAIPVDFLQYNSSIRLAIKDLITKCKSSFLMGSIIYDKSSKSHEDVGLLFGKDGNDLGYYSSIAPAPFNIAVAVKTKDPHPVGEIGVTVCWEELDESIYRRLVRSGAKYFISLSNDQDVDSTHFHRYASLYSRARAAENGRFLARAANTGITQIVNPMGRVVKELPAGESASLTDEIYPVSRETFYSRHGDLLVKIALVILLSVGFFVKSRGAVYN